MNINFLKSDTQGYPLKGTLVLGSYEDANFLVSTKEFDKKLHEQITKGTKKRAFKGKKGETVQILLSDNDFFDQILIVGLGDVQKLTQQVLQEVGAKIHEVIKNESDLTIHMPDIQKAKNISASEAVAYLASGFDLYDFSFDKYKTKKKDEHIKFENINFITLDDVKTIALFKTLKSITEGVHLTRTVVSEPPNVLYPESMAELAKDLTRQGVIVEIFNKQDMQRMNMGGLLGVAQGSIREPRLIVMQWLGGDKKQAPVAIVGKGITFDSGGISIKPSANMEDMKYDMAGSGVVLGVFKSLAARKAKVNVVGVMAMAENMPSGSALKPADVLTTMSGQTVEVQNTDAEGRLVLADALWYAQDRFKPQSMIDLATLTGAIVVSLGAEHAGLFSNNNDLAAKLLKAGDDVSEHLWRLPMGPQYDKDIDSVIADMKNIGSGNGAGSITAAQFLKRFVNDTPWAHLDIAGTSWNKKGRPLSQKGATAFGVRLLNQYLMDHFESA